MGQGKIFLQRVDGWCKSMKNGVLFHPGADDENHPNGQFALTYAELMAPSLGIGTCWAGFLLYGLKEELPRLMEIFQIPEDKKVTAAIMIGVPKVRYQRLVERAPLETTWL